MQTKLSPFPEGRRLIKNQFWRIAFLAFLALILLYKFKNVDWVPHRFQKEVPSRSLLSHAEPQQHVVGGMDLLQPRSAVGKVHAVFGEPNPLYERALSLHEMHAEKMGHPMFVLRKRLLPGLWSKPAYILSIILKEMAKPREQQLEWLLWVDADIVLMNPQIPLDVFIPPSPEFDDVNMLVTHDRHGLNNGCFLIRVSPWAIKLLSGVIAYHNFRPEVELKYTEQSALEAMINDTYWGSSVVQVPQYWFNAYPSPLDKDRPPRKHEFRPGGLQIHFAGNRDGKRPERMETWMSIADKAVPPYDVPVEETSLPKEIEKFWKRLGTKRRRKAKVAEAAGGEGMEAGKGL